VEAEVQESKQKYNELLMERNAESGQRQEKISGLEKQLEALTAEMTKSEEQVLQLDQLVNEKNQLIEQLLQEQEQQNIAIEGEVVSELQHQLMVIQKENDQLKQDAILSQQEIGEVLISARKQANRMVEKAKLDAQRIIQNSESEMQTIHDRAKEISFEVEESRQAILGIYEELKSRTDQLMLRKLPNTEEVKERYDFSKTTIMAHKDA
jgi:DNA repair exonuclease SbcCD ATPase subunit